MKLTIDQPSWKLVGHTCLAWGGLACCGPSLGMEAFAIRESSAPAWFGDRVAGGRPRRPYESELERVPLRAGARLSVGRVLVSRPHREPTYLRIRWESDAACEEQAAVTLEAVLCLRHRQEIALRYPSARGCGKVGESCELCDGRVPHGSRSAEAH